MRLMPIVSSLLLLSMTGCSMLPPGSLPTSTPMPVTPPSGYEPQPGDEKLTRDQVFLDLGTSTVVVDQSHPVQASVNLTGDLSDPCHQLRVVVTPPSGQHEITLEVYSLFNPHQACITVLKPFHATIPLGSFAEGHFTVSANGQIVGEFDA